MHPGTPGVRSATVLGGGEHDLRALEPQRDLVVVDVLDRVTIDLAADLGEHVGRARAIEEQGLVALGHDPHDAQRNLVVDRVGMRSGRFRGLGVVGAHPWCEQSQREHTGDETHRAEGCNLRS
jgi:hypothetical protein